MSVISVNEARDSRAGTDNVEGKTNWTRAFLVLTNDIADDQAAVLSATGIPVPWELHPSNSYLACSQREAKVQDDDFKWLVVCQYSPYAATLPNALGDKIDFSTVSKNVPADKAYADSGDTKDAPSLTIKNSADDVYDPPLEKNKRNLLIRIVKRLAGISFDPDDIEQYADTLNKMPITVAGVVIAKWQGLIREITAAKGYDAQNNDYYDVSFEVEVDRRTHVRHVLDVGFYEHVAGTDIRTPILDTEGQLTSQPRMLDGGGLKKNDASPEHWDDWRINWDISWAGLNLPTSL